MGRQMFNQGGMVDPMMEQGMPMEPPMAPPMEAPMASPMSPPGMADPEMEMAAQAAMEKGIDPAELEGLLSNYSQNMDDLEGAENYETVINTIRGDEMPMEARYAELASMVGPEDAQATPESVLTLVQPVMLMNSMDQGIGSLAEDQMGTPVEGPMAGGIMSTVDMAPPVDPMMAPPVDPMMAPPAGVPPVNFNQGGAVRGAVQYMEDGGTAGLEELLRQQDAVLSAQGAERNILDLNAGDSESYTGPADSERLRALYDARKDLYGSIIDPSDQSADLQKQTDLTKAQMLFDVAQGALAFAGPSDRQMSAGEKLASSFSPVLGNIGARAGELNKFKQAQRLEDRQMRMAALQSADRMYTAERAAEMAAEDKQVSDTFVVTIKDEKGEIVSSSQRPLTVGQFRILKEKHGAGNVSAQKVFRPSSKGIVQKNFLGKNGEVFSAFEGTQSYADAVATGLAVVGDIPASAAIGTTQYTLTKDIKLGDATYAEGSSPLLTDLQVLAINNYAGADTLTEYQEPKFSYTTVSGGPGGGVDIVRIDENNPDAKPISIYSKEIVGKPDMYSVKLENEKGEVINSVVDLSTTAGKAVVGRVNEQMADGKNATLKKIPTESTKRMAYLLPNSGEGGGATMRLSYDGGATYVDDKGFARPIPNNAVPVGNDVAYDVYSRNKVRADAKTFLSKEDTALSPGMGFQDLKGDGSKELVNAYQPKDKALVKDAFAQVRAGMGPWSTIFAGLNAVVGGTLAPETFSKMFKKTEEGRQFTKLVYVLGRSALATSPRFALGDLTTTGELFPNVDDFFSNPVTEANKLVALAKVLRGEEIRLQRIRASDSPVDDAILATAEQKLGEINRLQDLLGPVINMNSNMASDGDISGAINMMEEKQKGMLPIVNGVLQ